MDCIQKYICLHCGQAFVHEKTNAGGRRKLYCSDRCRNKHTEKPRRAEVRVFVCEHCGKFFETDHKRRFCSAECRKAHSQQPWVPVSVRINYCKHCGKATKRPVFCSRECSFAHLRRQSLQRQEELHKLQLIKKLIRQLKRRAKELQGSVRSSREYVCDVCGVRFEQYAGRPRKYCSDRCRRKSDAIQSERRAHRALVRFKRRKGIDSPLNEVVDPFEIFERDEWKCQVCGEETPKELRGAMESNSPELDHIVPISCGGLHNRANLRCCCRSCNRERAREDVCKGLFTPPMAGQN